MNYTPQLKSRTGTAGVPPAVKPETHAVHRRPPALKCGAYAAAKSRRAACGPIVFILATTLLLGLTAMAQSNRSVYTPLEARQCRTIKSAGSEEGEDYAGRCRGVAGYTLIVTEGDLRQNITVVTPQGAKHSLDLWEVVSGGFSSVGPKAEWRMATQKGKSAPVALIVRYNANEDPEKPNKITSYLTVTKITPAEICVTDKIQPGPKSNEDARRAADEAANKPCLKGH